MNNHQQKCADGIFTGIFLSHPVSMSTKNAINWHIFTILKQNYIFLLRNLANLGDVHSPETLLEQQSPSVGLPPCARHRNIGPPTLFPPAKR